MNEYYKYNNNVYKLLDHGKHKNPDSINWIPVVIYTDGVIKFTREVGDFYDKFTQIPYDSLEARVFELKISLI